MSQSPGYRCAEVILDGDVEQVRVTSWIEHDSHTALAVTDASVQDGMDAMTTLTFCVDVTEVHPEAKGEIRNVWGQRLRQFSTKRRRAAARKVAASVRLDVSSGNQCRGLGHLPLLRYFVESLVDARRHDQLVTFGYIVRGLAVDY